MSVDVQEPDLIVGCPTCGTVLEDLQASESEVRRLRRKVKALEEDKNRQREQDPMRETITEIFERWAWVTNHKNSKLTADRFDAIRARLREGYTKNALLLAVEGIGANPYVVNAQRKPRGNPDQRHDKLTIAMAGGENVEKFANLGARWRRDQGMPVLDLEAA